jgi:glycosyltransferase involved in cell wall biosynthesis
MKLYVRRVLAGVDAAIVLGESLRYIFEGLLPKERIVVVPNGGDFLYDRELRANGEPRMVLFLSNLQETKGVFEVLGAAQLVLRKCKDVKFVIAGEERIMKGKLREVMKEKNLESAVECVGTVTGNEKAKLFASADIFILPTFYPYEGHPWVIIEAMAAGLPIVTTDQGCIRESVIDGINGFIVPKRDEKILADRILLLLEDDALRAELGRQGRALYNQNFTEKNFIGNLKGVFQRVLACEDHRSAD